MNTILVLTASLWGLPLGIASWININQHPKTMIPWFLFGVFGLSIHLRMDMARAYGGKIGSAKRLAYCTAGQLLTLFAYVKTRNYFVQGRGVSDASMAMIATIMVARLLVWGREGFRYTEKMLYDSGDS